MSAEQDLKVQLSILKEAQDPARRLEAIEALRLIGGLQAIPDLVESAKRDPDQQVRAAAAAASRWLTENRSNPRDPYGVFGL